MRFEAALAQAKEWDVKLRYWVDPWLKIVASTRVNAAYSELHAWNEAIGKWEPATIKVEQALGDRWETELRPKRPLTAWLSPNGHVLFTTDDVLIVDEIPWRRASWLDEPPAKIEAPTKPEGLK